jgi:hypothetical protein
VSRPRRRVVLIGAITVFATACATKKPAAQVAAPEPTQPSATGTSKYAFVFDPANPALKLDADVKFMRPVPLGALALPVYPADALAAGDGPHLEFVRIVIDEHGDVSRVEDSPLGASDGGPHAAAFRHAVDQAVRTWRFGPGALLKVAPGNDLDGDGKADYSITTSTEIVSVYYDVKFTFEIVDGKGVVRKE